MPKVTINLTPKQVQWIESKADPFSGKSAVIRAAIDQAMRNAMIASASETLSQMGIAGGSQP